MRDLRPPRIPIGMALVRRLHGSLESGRKAGGRFVLGGLLLTLLPAGLAHGQSQPPMPETTSAPTAASDTHGDEIAGLRQQIDEMQQRLKAQQCNSIEQAIKFQQLEPAAAGPGRQSVATGQPAAAASCRLRPTRRHAARPIRPLPAPSRRGLLFPSPRPAADPCYPRAIVGGQYRMMFNAADYGYHPVVHQRQPASQGFINERLRTLVDRADQRQRGGLRPGPDGKRFLGYQLRLAQDVLVPPPDTADDQVGMMLRYGYLAYHDDCLGRLQAGIQGWQDSFRRRCSAPTGISTWVDFPGCENSRSSTTRR